MWVTITLFLFFLNFLCLGIASFLYGWALCRREPFCVCIHMFVGCILVVCVLILFISH